MCDAALECRHCTRRSCLQLSAGPLSSRLLHVSHQHQIFIFNILQVTLGKMIRLIHSRKNEILYVYIFYYTHYYGCVLARLFRGLTQELV